MSTPVVELPGMNCGMCGFKTCDDFGARLTANPELMERCIHLSKDRLKPGVAAAMAAKEAAGKAVLTAHAPCGPHSSDVSGCSPASCGPSRCSQASTFPGAEGRPRAKWLDSLGREFDFYLEHFPEDPGPREVILPHNPMITRELDIQVGDTLIGRPLGMSCGCPITHCGVVREVDHRTGVLTWCVTGPLGPREHGYKDLGYYIAEAYEGLATETRQELRIGARYYFQPRMCMLQWRHSGLLNYLNITPAAFQIRLEGLLIG